MKKYILTLVLSLISLIAISSKLNITLSKNSLELNQKDSIVYKFYLPSGAHTNIKFINIYGGEEIVFETGKSRAKGWHEVVLYSDSLKKYFGDLSSGVYYLEIEGRQGSNKTIDFNSFQTPWGEFVTAENVTLNQQTGEITYELPKFSMIRTTIGLSNSGIFRSYNWNPQTNGHKSFYWDGFDQTGKTNALGMFDLSVNLLAFGLPNTCFYLINLKKEINFKEKTIFPENWKKYAIMEITKKPWNIVYDFPLEFEIEMNKKDTFTISFSSNMKHFETLKQMCKNDNEIYITVNGDFFIEKYNIKLTDKYTISIPALTSGIHLFIANLFLENEKTAIGLKKLKIK